MTRYSALLPAALSLALAACTGSNPPPAPVWLVETHRSGEQRLVVVNDLGTPVRLIETSGADYQLPPGNEVAVVVKLASVGQIEPAQDGPWQRFSDTGVTTYVVPPPPPLLKQADQDIELRLRQDDGTYRTVRLSFRGCFPGWEQAAARPAEHRLSLRDLTSKPAGVPTVLCPK